MWTFSSFFWIFLRGSSSESPELLYLWTCAKHRNNRKINLYNGCFAVYFAPLCVPWIGNQLFFLIYTIITTYNRNFSKQRVIVYCCIHGLNKCHNLCLLHQNITSIFKLLLRGIEDIIHDMKYIHFNNRSNFLNLSVLAMQGWKLDCVFTKKTKLASKIIFYLL